MSKVQLFPPLFFLIIIATCFSMVRQLCCENCGNMFPAAIIINGERKNKYNRKYCYNCSPIDSHNTTSLNPVVKRACVICNKELTGNQKKFCSKLCSNKDKSRIAKQNVNRTRERIFRFKRSQKENAVKYLGEKCSICGFKGDNACFDFHHNDLSTKESGISRILKYNWDTIKKELDKCVLVCGNCHEKNTRQGKDR